jgi:uncharacterized protein YndB with AHSA1/START domain
MPKTIQQTVRFDAPPERVYALYADPRLHAQATGQPARFTPKAGSDFHAHGPHLRGRLLALEPSRLVLSFAREGRGTVVRMVHAHIPDAYVKSIRSGWNSAYWTPWRRYLRSRR